MNRTELEQIYYLNRELKMWEDELTRLRARSLVASPLPSTSHGTGISDKVAQRTEREMELEARIQAKRDEIQELRNRAVSYITTIPDSLTRMVVYYRCVSLFGWRRVAYEIGGSNTEESVRKIYTRFFERQN